MKKSKVTDAELSLLCQKCTELAKDLKGLTERLQEGQHYNIRHRKLKAELVLDASYAFRNLAHWLEGNP